MPRSLRDEASDQLGALIADQSRSTEHECRSHLHHLASWLCRETVVQFVYVETEYRGNTGVSDYVVAGLFRDETYVESVQAYLWELKAPQSYIFEWDNENRVRPTDELMQAENQLIQYYDELKRSGRFLERFEVTHPDDVKLGGIIIGSNRTKVRGDYSDEKKAFLFRVAKRARDQYLYHGIIRLVTWDVVLDQLRPPQGP